MGGTVFISYQRADREYARYFAERLAECSYTYIAALIAGADDPCHSARAQTLSGIDRNAESARPALIQASGSRGASAAFAPLSDSDAECRFI